MKLIKRNKAKSSKSTTKPTSKRKFGFVGTFFSLIFSSNPIGRVVKEIFTNKALFSKVAITFFVLLIFRGMAAIPLPGIDMQVFKDFFGKADATEGNYFFAIFTGGQLDSPSIVGLGIAAFINASIILQLLTPVIPKLHELSKEGERGSQAIQQYTRYLTVPLAFFYSIAYLLFLSKRDLNSSSGTSGENASYLIGHAAGSEWPTVTKIIFMALLLTAGTMIVMWLAEIISEKGIGNGSSIIIGIGILSSIPGLLKQDFSSISIGNILSDLVKGTFDILTSADVLIILGIIIGALITIIAIVFINESARKIKIQQPRRAAGFEDDGANFPIKLTVAGVMPIIFASALLSVPQLIVPLIDNFADKDSWLVKFASKLKDSIFYASKDSLVDGKDIWYAVIYFVLIVGFSMFYSFITLKPDDAAENLQKSGKFISGIRPGQSTAKYISNVLLKISFAGGIFLAIIGIIPLVARDLVEYETGRSMAILSGIGGTSVLIIISVVLDTVRQYNSLKVARSYEKYVK